MNAIAGRTALWTSREADQATGGRSNLSWTASGVSIDSRTINPGDLFVAIRGPVFDGHAFVSDAFQRGAAAAVVVERPKGLPAKAPLLVVDDTLEALRRLGAASRSRTVARIVAVTGSVGKTGTKEALRKALSRQGLTAANEGNLNNHWGVPLSLARMPKATTFGVFEIGMNHPGEIEPLSRLVRPDVAIITTVEAVHYEYFGGLEGIADAKAEIFAGMSRDGVAIVNRDNHQFRRLCDATGRHGVSRAISFGAHAGADVRLVECYMDAETSTVTADVLGRTVYYRIGVPGRHWVMNSLAVLGAVSALGGDVDEAASALAELQAPDGRGRRHTVPMAGGELAILDESYNASPVSMRAAFDVLGRMPVGATGRRIAVLGDMLELGANSADRHAELAEPLIRSGIDLVFTAGNDMRRLRAALPADLRAGHAADSEALAPIVAAAVQPGDVVMVKGSAGSRMRRVVKALLEIGREDAAPIRTE